MDVIFALLPLFFIMVLIFLFIISINRNKTLKVKKKSSMLFFKMYSGILILGTIAYFIIPNELVSMEEFKRIEADSDFYHETKFYDDLLEGKFEPKGIFEKQKQWEFPMEANNISLAGYKDQFQIIAERTEELDNRIEVYYYSGEHIVDGFDVSHLISIPTVKKEREDTIRIHRDPIDLTLFKVMPEMHITMFETGSFDAFFGTSFGSSHHNGILFFRIPANVNIDYEWVEYIQN